MAGSQYVSNPKNPFFAVEDDPLVDDVDDETFLKNSRVRDTNLVSYQNQERDYLEDKRQELLERKRMIEERTVQSSERSIGLLRDSEQIGVATAEELMRQREQLERTERRLDDINTTLRFSQKHIQGIKSVFGSLKNYISGKSSDCPPAPTKSKEEDSVSSSDSRADRPLSGMVEKTRSMPGMSTVDSHPGMKIRGLGEEQSSYGQSRTLDAQTVINQNLDEMLGSVTRLKGFAQAMGEEIDSQNDLLEGIIDKTDKADLTLDKQNKDMARLLKKK